MKWVEGGGGDEEGEEGEEQEEFWGIGFLQIFLASNVSLVQGGGRDESCCCCCCCGDGQQGVRECSQVQRDK